MHVYPTDGQTSDMERQSLQLQGENFAIEAGLAMGQSCLKGFFSGSLPDWTHRGGWCAYACELDRDIAEAKDTI